MENIDLSIEDLYYECRERADSEGAMSQEEWDSVVDDLLEEKREAGELHDDDDVTAIREALQSRFEETEESVPEI